MSFYVRCLFMKTELKKLVVRLKNWFIWFADLENKVGRDPRMELLQLAIIFIGLIISILFSIALIISKSH
jgi:hypothetical protein